MRTIKFRVWDITKKKYIFNCILDAHGLSYEDCSLLQHRWKSEEDRFIFQQFTGLKDKKKKEIYDGDIVVSSDTDKVINVIAWDDESACFTVGDNLWPNAELIVIGNTFQNPDLIK